jgi:flavodoxin
MKILITCSSLTGNTYKIAEAIQQELGRANETDLIAVDKVDADNLKDYDLVFLGSPIHAGGLAAPVKDLLGALPDKPGFKLAAFVTHASSAYSRQGFESGIQQFEDISKEKEIVYFGCYDCQGRLTPELHDSVQQAQKASDEEWAEKMAECDKHPDAEDIKKAKDFAGQILVLANS